MNMKKSDSEIAYDYRERARSLYARPPSVSIAVHAAVAVGEDGAFVEAQVWVPDRVETIDELTTAIDVAMRGPKVEAIPLTLDFFHDPRENTPEQEDRRRRALYPELMAWRDDEIQRPDSNQTTYIDDRIAWLDSERRNRP